MLIDPLSSEATVADAQDWLRRVVRLVGPGFHPDTLGEDYVTMVDGKRLFSTDDAAALDRSLAKVFELLGDELPYEVAFEEAHSMLGVGQTRR